MLKLIYICKQSPDKIEIFNFKLLSNFINQRIFRIIMLYQWSHKILNLFHFMQKN